MTDAVALVNQALGQINSRAGTVTSISPPAPPNNLAAQTAAALYQQQVNSIFRAANWNCARRQGDLTLLKARIGAPENPSGTLPQPPYPWLFEYAYPNDCLKVRFVMPLPGMPTAGQAPLMTNGGVNYGMGADTRMPFVPAIDTDANGNQIRVILTNACKAQAIYTGRIDNVDLWDDQLKNAVVGALAAWFCIPVTGSDKMMAARTQMAVGLLNAARISDGNEGITSVDHVPDWMNIRNAGEFFWGFNGSGSPSAFNAGMTGGWDAWGGPDGVAY